jgi:hypothetical protein
MPTILRACAVNFDDANRYNNCCRGLPSVCVRGCRIATGVLLRFIDPFPPGGLLRSPRIPVSTSDACSPALLLAVPTSQKFTMVGRGKTHEEIYAARCLLCATAVVSSLSRGVMEINASFTRRLTVLAPLISDAEYKTLKARWANMRGKADYDALVTAMDKRAAELGVTLPPVRKP